MDKQLDGKIQGIVEIFVKSLTYLTALMAFLIVIPLTLWSVWGHHSTVADSAVQTLLCLSFAWAIVSMVQAQRSLRRLGLSSSDRMRLFSGPRPDDPDELRAWKWAWQFMYAVIVGIVFMIAIPITSWLIGK
jgi:hypothetical protein